MSRRARTAPAGLVVAILATLALILPGTSSAHAYLVKTAPAQSAILAHAPQTVQLTFDEAVEPRFAIISVTDTRGRQETTTATVTRSPSNPDTLTVPLRADLTRGWYLIYWRAISVDGHPVQGAYTFAVGPDPGPAPQFKIPSIAGSATSLNLLVARWAMFLLTMTAIGLFVFRMLIARPVARARDANLRAISRLFVVSSVLGLIAIPVYLDIATSIDSLRSSLDVGDLVGLFRTTAFGRGYVDMLLCFGMFCVAAWIALWVDRSDRARRSLVEMVATMGALLAGTAVLVLPGASGHAAQTAPRGLSILLDLVHLLSSAIWLGGLIGLVVLWMTAGRDRRVPALGVVAPRFSAVALGCVAAVLATGIWSTIDHLPALDALWRTGYGVVILVKIGLVLAAMALGAVNLLRTTPALAAAGGVGVGDTAAAVASPATESAARLLRRMVGFEAVILAAAVFAGAILSSLAPPPPSFALTDDATASVGPGEVVHSLTRDGYRLQLLVSPNKAAVPDSFSLRISRNGRAVTGATVTLTFNETEMSMPQQQYALAQTQPGVYTRRAPALLMAGRWALSYQITPKGGTPFTVLILDRTNG